MGTLIMTDSDFTIKEDLMVGGLHWKSHHHLIAAIQLAYKLQQRGNRACMAQHAVGLAPSPNVRYYISPLLTDSPNLRSGVPIFFSRREGTPDTIT